MAQDAPATWPSLTKAAAPYILNPTWQNNNTTAI